MKLGDLTHVRKLMKGLKFIFRCDLGLEGGRGKNYVLVIDLMWFSLYLYVFIYLMIY